MKSFVSKWEYANAVKSMTIIGDVLSSLKWNFSHIGRMFNHFSRNQK